MFIAVCGVAAVAALWLWSQPVTAVVAAMAFLMGMFVRQDAARVGRDQRVPEADLLVHLSRCRRRQEGAEVLVVRGAKDASRLERALRLTDSSAVIASADGYELHAVLDRDGLDRYTVERRMLELGGSSTQLGWASFPEHGVALPALIEEARPFDVAPVPSILPLRAIARGSDTSLAA